MPANNPYLAPIIKAAAKEPIANEAARNLLNSMFHVVEEKIIVKIIPPTTVPITVLRIG